MICGLCQSRDYSLINPVLEVGRGQNSVMLKKIIVCLFYSNDAWCISWRILKKKCFYTLNLNLKSITEGACAELLAVEFISEGITPLCLPIPAPLSLNRAASAFRALQSYFVNPEKYMCPREFFVFLSFTWLSLFFLQWKKIFFFLFKPIFFSERTKKKTSIFVPFEVALRAKYDPLLHS